MDIKKKTMSAWSLIAAAACVVVVCGGGRAIAQTRVDLSGSVVDPQGLALPGVTVNAYALPARGLAGSTVTDASGAFMLHNLAAGRYVVEAKLQGFQTRQQDVDLSQSASGVRIALAIASFEQQVVVTAQMPEVATEAIVPGQQLERTATQDVAGYLRTEPGVNAVRRGSINLEPTVRGLYEAQMGVFVDGTRTFAAGPARMDSEISHVSPHMLESVQVIKGPYALTEGSGTLSSLSAQIFRPAFSGASLRLHGRGTFNFTGNGTAPDGFAGAWAATDKVRFTVLHNTQIGHDYTDGTGATVQGDYQSYDTRWDFGVRPSTGLRLEYEGGYQDQKGLDYPGRILDATYVRARSQAGEVSWQPENSSISEVYGQVYANLKSHRMNNDNKPTAQPMAGRVPPFGLRVDLPTTSNTVGGRAYVTWRQGDWQEKVGGDVYRLAQNATRFIYRRDTDALLFQDSVWPDAKLTNGGGYGQVVYQHGPSRIGGTLRVDTFRAKAAGQVSDFFLANTTGSLDSHESDVSAAINSSIVVDPRWTLTLGMGRAVRPPDALERYSDRFQAAQFQIASEFMGNPQLTNETSLEFNAGSIVQLPQTVLRIDAFYRTIDHYITVTPDASLPRRLPLDPPLVYRYINGTQARFRGYEASATTAAGSYVGLRADWSYLWAEDETFHEPAFGIAPFEQHYGVELHTPAGDDWIGATVTVTSAQNRVAVARHELPTPGWATLDLRGGLPLPRGFTLRAGIENVTNKAYVEHLNSLDPFTGDRILERGRSGYAGVDYAF
jgi:iron complex outermembrane recepter protein